MTCAAHVPARELKWHSTFFDELCLVMNSYIVLRIAYIGED